jgi:hypothetical protein
MNAIHGRIRPRFIAGLREFVRVRQMQSVRSMTELG